MADISPQTDVESASSKPLRCCYAGSSILLLLLIVISLIYSIPYLAALPVYTFDSLPLGAVAGPTAPAVTIKNPGGMFSYLCGAADAAVFYSGSRVAAVYLDAVYVGPHGVETVIAGGDVYEYVYELIQGGDREVEFDVRFSLTARVWNWLVRFQSSFSVSCKVKMDKLQGLKVTSSSCKSSHRFYDLV